MNINLDHGNRGNREVGFDEKTLQGLWVKQIMEFNDEQWTEAHRGSLEHMPNLVHEKLQLCGSLRRDVTMEVVSRTSKLGSRR